MKYMLLMYGDEKHWTDDERRACMIESMAICDELRSHGQYIASAPLESVATAVSVRVRGGRTLVTDGPFAETKEQLGGYYLLELESLNQAIEIASRLPPVHKGTVEIRPILSLEGLPSPQQIPSGPTADSGRPFMLLCYDSETAWRDEGPEALDLARAEAASLARELGEAGRYISASPLESPTLAKSVRIRQGNRVVTDGPFAETHEILGGYYIILANNSMEAVQVAARHPGARLGTVEVRPLFDVTSLRSTLHQPA